MQFIRHIQKITSVFLSISILSLTGCYRSVDGMIDRSVEMKQPVLVDKKVSRAIGLSLFTNLSRRPGVEVEILEKLSAVLSAKGFQVHSPLMLKMPTKEIHEDTKLTIVSDYYNYKEGWDEIRTRELDWLITGYFQDGPNNSITGMVTLHPGNRSIESAQQMGKLYDRLNSAKLNAIKVGTAKDTSSDQKIAANRAVTEVEAEIKAYANALGGTDVGITKRVMLTSGANLNESIMKLVEHLASEDANRPIIRKVPTGEEKVVGTEIIKVPGKVDELDMNMTLTVAGGGALLLGLVIVALVGGKKGN